MSTLTRGGDFIMAKDNLMYCVKCREKREGKDRKKVTMKNGKPATKAVCEVCGTTMFRIGG